MRVEQSSMNRESSFPVKILVTNPLGISYADTISLPLSAAEVREAGRWLDLSWNYRKGVQFNSKGSWIFSLISTQEKWLVRDAGMVVVKQSNDNR